MMTSIEIAQMLSAQNSMFMGQRSFAQQVGLPTSGGGFQRVPGAPGAPPVWNAAPGGAFGPGMQGGNSFAGTSMSMMSAGMTGLGMAASGASMFGALGKAAPFLDPFSGAAAGFARFGLLGGAAGAAMPLAIGSAAASFGHHFIQGGQQQQMVSNQLQQFQFANSASRTGMGFTRDDSQAIGSQMRAMSHLPEMMTSMEELTRMLPKLKSAGMMQGVRDATEFAQRFKESIKTIRDVSKVLGTTMEDAADFFSHSRSVGFLGRQSQLQNVMNAQFTSGVTGMSTGQVMSMQQAGAGLAQSMGAKRSLGAKAVTNIAQSLGLAQQQGLLADGALEDVTGMQGPEAIQAASQRFAGVLANVAQSSAPGRLSMAGLVKFDAKGKAIGIDEDLARQYREGSISISDLKKRAGSLTRAQKVSFTARAADLAMDFAGKTGPQGISNLLSEAASQRYGNDPEAVNILLQRQGGLSSGEADIFQSMQSFSGGESSMRSMGERRARESLIRERTDPSAILKRAGKRLNATLFGGVEEAGGKIYTAIGKAYDDFIDDLVGRHVATLSKEGADSFSKAMTGGGKEELRRMFATAHGLRGVGGDSGGLRGLRSSGMMGVAMMANPLTAGFAATAVGAKMLFQNRDAIGESDIGAYLMRDSNNTGRTATAELRHLKGLLGGGSADRADQGTSFAGQKEAAAALDQIRTNIDGFRGMTDARKLDEMRSSVSSTLNKAKFALSKPLNEDFTEKDVARLEAMGDKDSVALIRAGRAGQKNLGVSDLATAAIAAGQSGMAKSSMMRVNFSGVASASGAAGFADVKAADKAVKDADKSLSDLKISEGTVAALKNRPDIRRAVRLALMGDPTLNDAIDNKDNDAAREALAKRGIKLSAEDLDTLRTAVDETKKAGKTETLGALLTYDDARRFSDLTVIKHRSADIANDLADGAKSLSGSDGAAITSLSNAISEFSKAPSEKSFSDVQSRISGLTKAISTAKGKDREALIRASGIFGEIAGGTVKRGEKMLGQTLSPEEIAKGLGVSFDENSKAALAGAGITGKTTLSRSMLEKAEQAISVARGTSEFAKKGDAATAGDKDQQIIETLKKMQTASSSQVELLTMLVSKATGENASDISAKVMKSARENADADAAGKAKN
jgi:hypothetical protein